MYVLFFVQLLSFCVSEDWNYCKKSYIEDFLSLCSMQESDQEPDIDEWHGAYVVSIQDYTLTLFTV